MTVTHPHKKTGYASRRKYRIFSQSTFVALALSSYLVREPLSSAILFYISGSALSIIWYIPDILAAACLLIFLKQMLLNNSYITIFITIFGCLIYFLIGILVSNSFSAAIAGIKLAIPLFIGFLLSEKICDRRIVRITAMITLAVSVLGIQYSALMDLPWDNASFEVLGRVKDAKEIVYMYGERRISGFAGDTHAAAFCLIAPFLLLFRRYRSWNFYAATVCVAYYVYLTNSRTTLISLVIFVVFCASIDFRLLGSRAANLIVIGASVAIIIVPFAIMVWASSVTQNSVSYELRSLWARGNDSWIRPFEYMEYLAPLAWLHGYGFGGIGYPLYLANMGDYYVPVDNFHLYNLLSFGLLYIPLYLMINISVINDHNLDRKMMYVMLSLFSSFLLGYGNPLFLILYGYTFRRVFLFKGARVSKPYEFGSNVVARYTNLQ